jgi:hypothetical protein
MPIVLIGKHTGQNIMVKGESSEDFFDRQRSGLIPVEWPDGHFGHVQKDAIWATKVIPLTEYNQRVEAEAKQKADQEAARAGAESERQAKLAANAEWRKKGAVIRLFTKKPHPEVG